MALFEDVNKNKEAVSELCSLLSDSYKDSDEVNEAWEALCKYLKNNNFFPPSTPLSERELEVNNLISGIYTACKTHGFHMGFNTALKLLCLEINKDILHNI